MFAWLAIKLDVAASLKTNRAFTLWWVGVSLTQRGREEGPKPANIVTCD